MSQETGNPVLDSLVNLLAGTTPTKPRIEEVHAALLTAAQKEPGGLVKRYGDSLKIVTPAESAAD